MKRRHAGLLALTALAATGVALGAGMVSAAAAPPSYSGSFDDFPNSEFHLMLGRKDGRRFVDRVEWTGATIQCENGSQPFESYWESGPRDAPVEHGEFRTASRSGTTRFLLKGALHEGRATGFMRVTLEGPQAGQGTCKTGRLEWSAERGL